MILFIKTANRISSLAVFIITPMLRINLLDTNNYICYTLYITSIVLLFL